MRDDQQGISNRETAAEESEERREFPPIAPDAPPAEQDAAERGDKQPEENEGRKVAGADGREP